MSELSNYSKLQVVALAGGVGGARLAQGLAELLSPAQLTVIVNTGDDFDLFGLTICPDLDTVTYTLAGLANPETGWGLAGDTFHCLENLERLQSANWFRLGDRDLATQIIRTQMLREGNSLTQITRHITQSLGVEHIILPMCDMPMRTNVLTNQGKLEFQTYFVRLHCEPVLQSFVWEGLDSAFPSPQVIEALTNAHLVVFCPSNPFVSLDPILMLPGVRQMIKKKICVGVSPIIGGKTVKGPAAKMFLELGITPSALAIAEHYQDLLNGFFLDEVDAGLSPLIKKLGIEVRPIPSLMPSIQERKYVAREVLQLGSELLYLHSREENKSP